MTGRIAGRDNDRVAYDEARAHFIAAQASGDPMVRANALLEVVHADDDAAWLQARCLELITGSDHANDRRLAVLCLGHIARLHGVAGPEVVSLLTELTHDPTLGGTAEDALADVEIFVGFSED